MRKDTFHSGKERGLVPVLRFKEFDGAWESQKLSTRIDFIAGYAFKSAHMKSANSNYQLIKMSNLYKNKFLLDRNPSYWEKLDIKHQKYLLKKKDILLTLTGTVGKRDYGYSVVIPESDRFLLNQRLVCLRSKQNLSDSDFINNLIKTSRFFYFFFSESKGGTGNQSNVSVEDLKKIKLNFPSLPEQKKIASFLSAIDKKIQQLTRKKALLEEYKKGLMQQVFSGALRFHDEEGKDYPDWEEKRLGEVLSIGSGKDYRHLGKGNIPVFGTGGYMLSVDDKLYEGETVFIGRKGTINKPFYFEGPFWTVDTLFYTYRFKSVIPGFIYVIFQQINWKLYNEASGVPSLSKSTIKNIKSKFPCIEEQAKIAKSFFTIDTKIATLTAQITKTQTFKKGLLQQMFV